MHAQPLFTVFFVCSRMLPSCTRHPLPATMIEVGRCRVGPERCCRPWASSVGLVQVAAGRGDGGWDGGLNSCSGEVLRRTTEEAVAVMAASVAGGEATSWARARRTRRGRRSELGQGLVGAGAVSSSSEMQRVDSTRRPEGTSLVARVFRFAGARRAEAGGGGATRRPYLLRRDVEGGEVGEVVPDGGGERGDAGRIGWHRSASSAEAMTAADGGGDDGLIGEHRLGAPAEFNRQLDDEKRSRMVAAGEVEVPREE